MTNIVSCQANSLWTLKMINFQWKKRRETEAERELWALSNFSATLCSQGIRNTKYKLRIYKLFSRNTKYQKQLTNDKLSNFCVVLTLKEYIYFCVIFFYFDLVCFIHETLMINAVFQSLIVFIQILLFSILVLLRRLRDSKYREQSDRKTFNVSPSYIFPTISIKYFYHDVAVPELFQTLRISWTVWQENS